MALIFLLLMCAVPVSLVGAEAQKLKIRAITAFVRLDCAHYQEEIAETLKMLRQGKMDFENGGYQVESIRMTTQPLLNNRSADYRQGALNCAKQLDTLAQRESFDANLGPALLKDSDDPAAAELLGEILSQTKNVEGSIIIADAEGIHWKSIQAAARLIRYVARHSPHSQGTFNFAATAMLAPYAPFYPGSYHTGDGHRFAVGWEAANVVEEAFAGAPGDATLATQRLIGALTPHALAVERIARQIERETGWTYVGLDATPAPLRDVSIGRAIEKYTGSRFGSSGTMTAASLITHAVAALPVKHVGYSGLMLPVMEDSQLADRWREGAFSLDSLLAYSAVCGTGLDTIPLPGDVTEEQLERVLGDVASLAVKWRKPLTARLQPVSGKKAGDRTEFDDPFLVNTLIRPLP
ncbi:MAG TPA: DUF711 family protein [Terriglobia bacterium]|nr:DUF711 family protein [Terriglobia bacterium]